MKFPGSLAAMALVVLFVHNAAAGPVPMQPAATESPTPPIASPEQMGVTFHRAPSTTPLPDSVLARIFFAPGRSDITRREFVQAAVQLELPPSALTPQLRAQVLDLLLQKRVLSRRAKAEPRRWAHPDSVSYNGLSDRLTLSAALDSAMAELGFQIAGRGDTIPNRELMGIMLRDSAMARLKPQYDDDALAMVSTAFANLPKPTAQMGLQEQMNLRRMVPSVSAADSARTLIRSRFGEYTVGQLLTDFGRLNPNYRPKVTTAEDVRDVANSVIYENMLRENIVKQDLVHRPSIAAQLAERAEFLDVQAFVRNSAYEKVPTDSVTLRRHYDRHPRWFDAWGRAEIIRGIFPTRASADSFAKELAMPGMPESLLTRTMPGGMRYATYLDENADTALFARVARAGTKRVVGPDDTQDGWRVIRATHVQPRKPRTFDEVHDIVLNDWYQREGDRRVRELMQKLVASVLVQINEPALARVAPAGTSRGMPGGASHGTTPRKPAAGGHTR